MSKARTLADIVAAGSPLVDGTIETTDITNVTASATELNYVDGVTSNVQTQLDTKAPTASPTFTGNVGIGTSSPSSKLEIVGSTGSTATTGGTTIIRQKGDTYEDGIAITSSNGISHRIWKSAGGSLNIGPSTSASALVQDSSGNVGIGTSSPTQKLDVNGKIIAEGEMANGGGGATISLKTSGDAQSEESGIAFYATFEGSGDNGTRRSADILSGFDGGTWGSQYLAFHVGNAQNDVQNITTERMRIGSSGELGIGGANYGTSGQVLTSGGSGAAPSWADAAGGGTAEFVASGAISSGDIVGLNTDGTISVVQPYLSSNNTFNSATTYHLSSTFDSNSNKVVVVYYDSSAGTGGCKAVVGTVSGTSISFGTAAVFEYDFVQYLSAVFDSSTNKVVIAYQDDGNSGAGTAVVGTVSGTSISFGTPVVFDSSVTSFISATFDSNSNRVVVAYRDGGNSNYGTAIVGSVSGTSISFYSPYVFATATTNFISSTFDSTNNKIIIAYQDAGNGSVCTAIVATVVGGNTLSYGTEVSTGVKTDLTSVVYVSNVDKIIVLTPDTLASKSVFLLGTVSGTSISFGEPVDYDTAESAYITSTFDSSSNKAVISFTDVSDHGNTFVISPADLSTFNAWIGFAAQDISDTSTGAVTVVGGVNESQTGLTTGSKYYLQNNATISTTVVTGREVGRATAAGKIFVTQGSIS